MVTVEGILRKDRADVLGSTRLDVRSGGSYVKDDGTVSATFAFDALQPARRPLHLENSHRIQAAVELGFRALHPPRIGWPKIEDQEKRIYVYESDDAEANSRQDRYADVADAIESRGLGFAQIKVIAEELAEAAGYGMTEPWYTSLGRAGQDDVARIAAAVSEWADGDTVAAHVAYQIN